MKLSTKYIGGIGEDLTGSSTLFKTSGKDSLSVVIDYGLHQGGEGDNELNNMTDDEVLKADFVIITHAHMDHIGRLPMLVAKGFEGRIIMTSMTKELASAMLINNVTLTTDQIKQAGDVNNKKANKLREYLKLLAINKKLKENNLNKGDKWNLEKQRDKLLKGGNIDNLLKESIDFLQSLGQDIDIARLLTKKQSINLLDIEDRIIEILENRENRIDTNKLEFDEYLNNLVDLKRKLKNGDNSEENLKWINKYLFLLSLYPNEIKGKLAEKSNTNISYSQEQKYLLGIQQDILNETLSSYKVSYTKSKSSEYRKEKDEMTALIKKRDSIVGYKDLELCINYSKKILGKEDDFIEIKSELPVLLYDTQMVYKTLEMIETLEAGEEMELESRMVINKIDSEVICRVPQIIKDGYSKKIYINHRIITGVIAKWNKQYNQVVEHNKNNKQLRNKFETANKFIVKYERTKDKSKIIIPDGREIEEYYNEQKLILESSDINKLKKKLEEAFSVRDIYELNKNRFKEVENKSTEYFESEIEKIDDEIVGLNTIEYGNELYDLDTLLKFRNENKHLINDYDKYEEFKLELSKLKIVSINDMDKLFIKNSLSTKKILSNVIFSNNENEGLTKKDISDLKINDLNEIINEGKENIIPNKLKSIFTRKINTLLKSFNTKNKNEKNRLLEILEKVNFYKNNKVLFENNVFNKLLNIKNSILELEKKKKILNHNKNLYLEYLEFTKAESYFKSQKTILDEYGILELTDISKVISKTFGMLDLPFTKKEIEKAKSRLVPTFEKENQRTIEKISLRFFQAGHVEGSVMASISIVTKKIENILNNTPHKLNNRGFDSINKPIKEYINFLFTGDMGKFRDSNISGTPDVPDMKYDYVQYESTYAIRNHPDKTDEFNKFIYELNTTYGNGLIPAFSFQRTQEILVELLQNKFDNLELLNKYPILRRKLKKLKKDFNNILSTNLEDLNESDKGLKIEKFLEQSELETELLEIEKKVFLGNIIVDSPLGMQISEIFLRKYPEKYKLLDPEYQKSVFGKVVVKILRQGEYKNLYKGNASKSRYIIISSGGMMQGGAIINHAKEIIPDKNSKIMFTGYQAKNTLGGEILNGNKNVLIDGDSYDVNTKIVSIGGYSSHIEKDDIIDFITDKLKLTKNAVLASTHGTSDRTKLKQSILDVNNKLNIIIPEIGDTYSFDL